MTLPFSKPICGCTCRPREKWCYPSRWLARQQKATRVVPPTPSPGDVRWRHMGRQWLPIYADLRCSEQLTMETRFLGEGNVICSWIQPFWFRISKHHPKHTMGNTPKCGIQWLFHHQFTKTPSKTHNQFRRIQNRIPTVGKRSKR